jgi:hypothetical protein
VCAIQRVQHVDAGKNGLLTQAPKRPRFVVKVASLKDAEQVRETAASVAITVANARLL